MNVAFSKLSTVCSSSSFAHSTVASPLIRLSTWRLFCYSASTWGSPSSQVSRWYSITPPRRKGDGARLTRSTKVNLWVFFLPQMKPPSITVRLSNSYSQKRLLRSPTTATGCGRDVTSIRGGFGGCIIHCTYFCWCGLFSDDRLMGNVEFNSLSWLISCFHYTVKQFSFLQWFHCRAVHSRPFQPLLQILQSTKTFFHFRREWWAIAHQVQVPLGCQSVVVSVLILTYTAVPSYIK